MDPLVFTEQGLQIKSHKNIHQALFVAFIIRVLHKHKMYFINFFMCFYSHGFLQKHFAMNEKLTSAAKTFNQLKRQRHARMYQHAYLFAVDVFSFHNLLRYMNLRLFFVVVVGQFSALSP